MIEASQIRDVARGRWRDILGLYGFRPEDLTGRNGPCPKCGGTDRFRYIDDDCGAVFCNQCFKEKNGDGIAAIMWMMDWTFPHTVAELAGHLGLCDNPATPRDIVVEVARLKRMPVDSFRAFGARADSRDGILVARVPMFDADLQQCSYFDLSPGNEKLSKGLCATGQPAGLFVVEADPPRAGDVVLLTEGVKDAAAAHGAGYKIAGLPGSELAAKFATVFAGCDVVIVPDRDETGEKAARTSAARLYGVARSVCIAVLPGACKPKGGDGIRETLAMKDGANLFRKAVANAKEWTPSGEKRRPQFVTMLDSVNQVLANKVAGVGQPIHCGLGVIDRAIKGAAPGEMIVLAARPSHGKSLVGMQWLDMATAKRIRCVAISEEMSALALAERQLSSLSTVPEHEWKAKADFVGYEIKEHFSEREELLIVEQAGTVAIAEKMIEQAVEQHGCQVAAVDYLQIVRGEGRSKYEQVSDACTRLKQLAVRLNVVLLLLCQLNRELDKRTDRAPKMSDLRDSGQIEQDADVMLFLQWPWKDDPAYQDPGEFRVYVAKNRNRGIRESILQLHIRPERQRIEEAATVLDRVIDDWRN